MTKSEFIDAINEASDCLYYTDDYGRTGYYLCTAMATNEVPITEFRKLFSPKKESYVSEVYFGSRYFFENQCDRFTALMLFKEYVISEKLYKGM